MTAALPTLPTTMDRLRAEWDEYLTFLTTFPGMLGGTPAAQFASLLATHAEVMYPAFAAAAPQGEAELAPLDLSQVPDATDYEDWSERERREVNTLALRVLKRLHAEQRAPLPEERRALFAYSGWGGVEISKLPDDPTAFDPEFRATISAYRDAATTGVIPPAVEGLRNQYFTQLPLCKAVWRLVNRIRDDLGMAVYAALEPSAGVARFIRTSSIRDELWTAVDMDPMITDIVRTLYPEMRTHTAAFENWYTHLGAALGPTFDVIVGNPPYGDRTKGSRTLDGYHWDRNEDYFLDRCLDSLAPGGVLAFVTMQSEMTTESRMKVRVEMLRRAHLAAAVALPADLFPGAQVQAMVLVLVGRPVADREVTAFTEAEQAIVEGRYWGGVVGETDNVMGEWVKGRFEGQQVLKGDFDANMIVNALVQPLSPEFVERARAERLAQIRAERASSTEDEPVVLNLPPTPPKVRSRLRVIEPPKKGSWATLAVKADAGIPTLAAALTYRLGRFQTLLQEDPSLAEVGREELVRDLTGFASKHGNPHGHEGILQDPGLSLLLEAVAEDGAFAPWLTSVAAPRADQKLAPDASISEVVSHYSKWKGVCTEIDLARHGYHDVLDTVVQDDALAIEFQPDGSPVFYRLDDYLTGALYARMDSVDAVLAGDPSPMIQDRLVAQKRALLATLQTVVISDVETVTPRSGFITVDCLADYLRHRFKILAPQQEVPNFRLDIVQGLLHYKPLQRVAGAAEGLDEDAADSDMMPTQQEFLRFLLGYWNRQEMVKSTEEGELGRKRRSKQESIEDRMAEDLELEDDFRAWLTSSDKWRDTTEEAYNRAYRGFQPRVYPTDPVPIARWNPEKPLRAHQNSGVRRFTDRRGGMAAWQVGYGKTMEGAAITASWRQEGLASRSLVTVPNSLVPNWIREVRQVLPDYRVAAIGVTIDPTAPEGKQATIDTEAVRKAKWAKFAAGEYDLLICPYSWFTLDVDVKPETQDRVLSRIFALQREIGLDQEEREIVARKIEVAQAEMKELEDGPVGYSRGSYRKREVAEARKKLKADPTADVSDFDRAGVDKLEKKLAKMEEDIARWEKKLAKPSDRILDSIRQQMDEFTDDIEKSGLGPIAWWDDLGVDCLIVDEAHNFKNLWGAGDRYGTDIEFMGSGGDKKTIRAWDLFIKCQELLARNNDGGVVLLTGTPIKNSPMEVYNLLSYVSRRVWDDRQIRTPEEFVDRFCELERRVTLDMSKEEMVEQVVVAAFKGQAELVAIMDAFVDRRMDPLPDVVVPEGTRDPDTDVPLDALQTKLMQRTRAAIEKMKEEAKEKAKAESARGGLHPEQAKRIAGTFALRQMSMMSKIALDPRLLLVDHAWTSGVLSGEAVMDETTGRKRKMPTLTEQQEKSFTTRLELLERVGLDGIEPAYAAEHPPKYRKLAQKIVDDGIVKDADGTALRAACGHVIFCDYNEPHEWIRTALADLTGIPLTRIAIVNRNTAQKPAIRQALADAFNGADEETIDGVVVERAREPKYDVLIGNSAVMAEGLNLQRRTCSIHHLTIPWEPATITQRNGRGVRQGNKNDKVWIRYYTSPRSFDAFQLNMVLGKLGWQKSLFEETDRSITNPSAGSDLSREEQAIIMSAENPEEELAKYREKKAEADAADTGKRRMQYARRFLGLVLQFEKARHATDPVRREAEFARGDQMARGLRLVPDALFPIKSAIDTARLTRVFYVHDAPTPTTLHEGERFYHQEAGEKNPVAVPREVVSIDLGGGYVKTRAFGSGRLDATPSGKVAAFVAGIVPGEAPTWDPAEDRKQIIGRGIRSYDIPSFEPNLALELEPEMLRSAFLAAQRAVSRSPGSAWNGAHYEQASAIAGNGQSDRVPLYRIDSPGTVVLFNTSVARWMLNPQEKRGQTALSEIMSNYRYLIPQNGSAFSRFLTALRTGALHEFEEPRDGTSALKLVPAHVSAHYGEPELNKLARYWFNRFIADAVFTQARAARSM